MYREGKVDHPSPYLLIWAGCKRFSTDLMKVMPNAGGWLDQDAEMMIAFEVIEEIAKEEEKANQMFQKAQAGQLQMLHNKPPSK